VKDQSPGSAIGNTDVSPAEGVGLAHCPKIGHCEQYFIIDSGAMSASPSTIDHWVLCESA